MSEAGTTTPERREFLIEHVMQVAEREADKAVATQTPDIAPGGGYDERLVALAVRELKQYAARAQLLPAALFSDTGWRILLRLFVSEHRGDLLLAPENGEQWDVGEETLLRHIAGLIALGLIVREGSNEPLASVVLTLTPHGRETLRKSLELDV